MKFMVSAGLAALRVWIDNNYYVQFPDTLSEPDALLTAAAAEALVFVCNRTAAAAPVMSECCCCCCQCDCRQLNGWPIVLFRVDPIQLIRAFRGAAVKGSVVYLQNKNYLLNMNI